MQVFLKLPEEGRVKTRLAEDIGEEAAVAAYRVLVARTLANLPPEFPLSVAYAPSGAEEAMRAWLSPHLRERGKDVVWVEQVDVPCLGDRLRVATGQLFAMGAGKILAVGADCPSLAATTYREAERRLHGGDEIVFGPAADGGYYLVGLASPQPVIFNPTIAWSSRRTLETSLQAARGAGLKISLLDEREDVDDRSSWERARNSLNLVI